MRSAFLWKLAGASLVLAACATAEPVIPTAMKVTAPPVHPLVNWVPGNAASLLYVNYALLKGDWKSVIDAGELPKARRAELGFVESEDVDHAVVCALGEGASPENLALYEGRFSDQALEGSQVGARGDLPSYREKALWGSNERALARLSPQRVGVGTRVALQGAIDLSTGLGESVVRESWFQDANEEMVRAWLSTRSVGLDLTAKSTGPVRDKLTSLFPEAAQLKWFSVRAGGNDDLDIVALGRAGSAESARSLVYAMAQQAEQWAQRPQMRFMGLSGVLNAIRFESRGDLAQAKLHIPASEWRSLKQRFSEILAFLRKRQAQAAQKGPGK